MNTVVDTIIKEKLVAIARNVASDSIVATAKALYEGGFRVLEVTFNQASPDGVSETAKSIGLVREAMGDSMLVGAGTALTLEQVLAAKEAGAQFVLAPNTDVQIIRAIVAAGMVAIPGALTPSEIVTAYQAGASIVKLFPAGNFGLDYVKAIRGPINHIPLMAVGGITEKNVAQFLDNGFCSAGIGSNVVRNALITSGNFGELAKVAKTFKDAIRECK